MTLIARADLEAAFGQEMILRLGRREDDPEANASVARAIDYAVSLVRSHLGARFGRLPNPVPTVLVALALDLALARLAGSDALALTDDIKHREAQARADLKAMAEGRMNIGLGLEETGHARPKPVLSGGGDKLFTRANLRGV